MTIINLSFYVVTKTEIEAYQKRHFEYQAIFDDLGRRHKVIHVHLCAPGVALPSSDEKNKYVTGRKIPFAVFKLVKEYRPDLVLLHSFKLPVQVILLRLFLDRQTKLVVQHHGDVPFRHPLKRWLQRMAYKRIAMALFCERSQAADLLERGVIRSPGFVREIMPLSTSFTPLDKATARRALNLPEKGPILLWTGRLNTNKDPFTLLNGLRAIIQAGCSFRCCLLYGTNELEKDVEAFVAEKNLAEQVSFHGKIAHHEMRAWYSAADVFISASHQEASGLSLCEAMACGCLPVVSDIPSFRYMTDNGSCAFLFPAGDHQKLARILQNLIEGNVIPLSKNPRQVFGEKLSYGAISRQLVAHLETL